MGRTEVLVLNSQVNYWVPPVGHHKKRADCMYLTLADRYILQILFLLKIVPWPLRLKIAPCLALYVEICCIEAIDSKVADRAVESV